MELLGEGALVVRVASPPRAVRGRLEGFLEDAVEAKLSALGASGPHPHAEDKLGDQLFRARAIGAAGLVLSVDPLAAIRSPALTPEDSTILTTLARATKNRPFVLLLDDDDCDAPAYGRPVPLVALLDPDLVAPERRPPTEVVETYDTAPPTIAEPVALSRTSPVAIEEIVPSNTAPVAALETHRDAVDALEPAGREAYAADIHDEPLEDEDSDPPDDEPSDSHHADAAPFVPADPEVLAAHGRALSFVRGPQPLAALKALFLSHYVPLGEILVESKAYGVAVEPRVTSAFTAFRKSFERAYSDAFPTFALTGKRPKMVLDAYEEATRLARASGARTTSLLMIPSLRADLGLRTHEALSHMLPEDALVESGLFFAALPSSSARQEDTLARGVTALGSPRPDESLPDPEWHARGTLRRVRMGARDLFCLDTVAAFRAAPFLKGASHPAGATFVSALRGLSESLAVAIARHAHSLVSGKTGIGNGRSPERTLLFVFGDHGFAYSEEGATRDGGATPEEVIVPYFAYALDPAN